MKSKDSTFTFSIQASAWLSAMRSALRAVISKPVIPALEDLHITIEDGYLRVEAGDTETWVSVSRQLIESQGGGSFLIPASLSAGPFTELGNTTLRFSVAPESHVAVTWDEGMVTIPVFNDADWPGLPALEGEVKTAMLSGNDFTTAISLTEYAVSKEEVRPVLTGIDVEFPGHGGGFRLVASDAHRLVVTKSPDGGAPKAFSVLAPRRCIQLVKALSTIGDVISIRTDGRHLQFSLRQDDMLVVTARIIEGKFPNWEAIIPKGDFSTAVVATELLSQAIDRAASCVGDSGILRLSFEEGRLTLTAQDPGFLTYAEMIVPCVHEGEPVTVGLRAKLIAEVIAKAPWKKVRFELRDPTRAVMMRDADEDEKKLHAAALVMPTMIES